MYSYYTKNNFSHQDIDNLLDQLCLIEEEREIVKKKAIAILNWENGEDCPMDIRELKDGIEGLEKLERFNHTSHMIFRDYVGPHSERVTMMHGQSQYIFQQVFGEEYNISYGNFYAAIHDILEGVSPFGDIITSIKDILTPTSDAIVKAVESKLAQLIIEYFFDSRFISHQAYVEPAFQDMFYKTSLPSQAVSYIDKACDGFMYTFHELVAGNAHFLGNFYRYINRMKAIYSGEKLLAIQKLFCLSREEYINYLGEIHGDYPENMEHFGDAIHLYDYKAFLTQEHRVKDILGICRPENMQENLEEDFGFPAYGVWKKTMLLLNPLTHNRSIIRPAGETLLTVPSTLIKTEKL